MPTKDPITLIGMLATIMLAAGAAMLYLSPEADPAHKQKPKIVFNSPFKEPTAASDNTAAAQTAPPTTETPVPEPPPAATVTPPELTLSEAELAKMTPAERERYHKTLASLQQVLQKAEALKQENTHLQQAIEQNSAKNKALDAEIDKLRPDEDTAAATRQ